MILALSRALALSHALALSRALALFRSLPVIVIVTSPSGRERSVITMTFLQPEGIDETDKVEESL